MKCLSTNTTTGNPCRKVVGRDGCPHHGNDHIQERLRQANRPTPAKPEQLSFPISPERIKQLIDNGYEMERRERTNADFICGCQG